MNLIKTFFLIIMMLAIVFFLSANSALVDIDILFHKFNQIQVSFVIFCSFAIGTLIGYLYAVFSILSAKAEIRGLQNKNKRLSEELNDLRNVAIEEDMFDSDGGEYQN